MELNTTTWWKATFHVFKWTCVSNAPVKSRCGRYQGIIVVGGWGWGVNVESHEYTHGDTKLRIGTPPFVTLISIQLDMINTLRPRQNGRHFPDDIFKCISLNENVWISIKMSLNFVPMGPINNIPTLVQIMAWRRPGDKPLSEPTIVCLPTHICAIRPRWVNMILYKTKLTMNTYTYIYI